MKNSIRLELIFVFALCFVTSAALGKVAGVFLQNRNITARIDYSKGIDRMSVNANLIGDEIKSKSISIDDKNKIQKIIDSCNDTSDLEKIMITDLNGKVLYKSNNINFMAEELNNKMKVEREEERIKNELITNVSHDLRTPLTSIKGYLALIKDKRYEDETQMKQYINIAYNKSEKLEELINDLFEYTKLTNNAVNLNRQSISLNGLLEQLMEELVPICEETGVTITRSFPKQKFLVYLDPNKTARVFENLFINAIRYSIKPGDVEVLLKEEKGDAVISIKNKCEPVSKEEVDKLFDRFYRVDKSRSSNTGGSGLGLAIAKSIVEIQGGKIKAEYSSGYMIFDVIFNLADSRS